MVRIRILLLYPMQKDKNLLKISRPRHDTKLHLMEKLQFWISGDYGVPLHCNYSQVYDGNHHHHHHHLVVPPARISLTLSRHSTLSFIASGRSSGLHPVSTQSRCLLVRAGYPALAQTCAGVYWRTSLMISSLLLQLCPACLVHQTLIVFVIGGRWLLLCGVLLPWLVQYCSQHSCVVVVKLFLHPFS